MQINKLSTIPVKYVINNNYRLTLYSSSLVRAEYSKNGLWDEENPIILDPTFNENVPHKLKEKGQFIIISTDYFELKILPDGKPFDIGNLYFTVKGKKITWQPGIVDTDNLGGAMLDLYKYPAGKSNEKFSEGLISKNGYFIFRNHCEFLWDNKKNWIKKKSDWPTQDWYMFGYGNDYKKAF